MAANKTFTELEELTTVDKNNDWMAVVDVSDTTASVYGTTKKANVSQFIGDKGEAATVDVGTTTTLSAGSDATVSNSGSTSAAVLDFGIPRGPQGVQGIQGVAGADGADGADGDSAYVYIAYASDASGTGFTTTFNAALDYIAVKATTTEITTPQASDFTGLWKNYKGIQGIQGEQGVAGEDGSSAYVYIAYASDANGTGFTTTFSPTLNYIAIKSTNTEIVSPQASDFTGLWFNYKGEKGDQGPQGEKGDAATVNVGTTTTGLPGTSASVVNSGSTSAAILDFTIPRGDKGEQGPQGPQGEPGEPGEDGLDITWRGTYSASTSYVVNDAVYYNGGSYICIQNTTGNLPTNETYWNLMAAQGEPGEGSGDVVGPDGATDNAIARFDLATGKLIQNSLATVSDTGSINIPAGQQYLVGGSPVEGYSDEQAQDAVGSILTDSSEIDFTYNDTTPSITASIKAGSIDETKLDTSVNASLDLADSAIQSADLATVATTGAYSDLSGTPDLTTKLDKATNVTAINDTGIADGEIAVFNLTNKDIRTSDKTLPSGAVVGTTDTQSLSNKTLTSPVINTEVSGTAILDEDNMASNSATKLATQQSIKAYVDSKGYTWKGAWATSTSYSVNDTVESNGSGYVCTSAHTSGSTTEPGVGASWTTNWDLFVEGTNKTMPTGDVVGTTDTQTLTNKTLTAPAITSPTISGAWDGWISAGETWTYASADDPTFTFTVASDVTTKYSAGMRIKLTQTTVKYFIITKVAYSSPNTTITLYGGTDFDLANATISNPYYSPVKCPYGFPLDPSKWKITQIDTSRRLQTNPAQNTWYNLGGQSIDIPIGQWKLKLKTPLQATMTSVTETSVYCCLSTSNNSSSDNNLVVGWWGGSINYMINPVWLFRDLNITSLTTYYLNISTSNSGVTGIEFRNSSNNYTIIEVTSAYL